MNEGQEPRVRAAVHDSMATDEVLGVLAASDIARGLSAAQRGALVESARIARYAAAGQTVVRAGEAADDFYVVLEGEVSVRHVEADGTSMEIARLGPGDTFGEAALVEGARLADVVTLGKVRLLLVHVRGLLGSADQAAWARPFLLNLARGAGERLRGANATADIVFAVTYFLLSPVQEMIARGCLQSSLEVFLRRGESRGWRAILLSNLVFATNHVHLSPWFGVLAFVPGVVWGMLYRKQRSLLGVAISHAIVGSYALKVLGMDLLARM